MVARLRARGKSELRRARVPGESRGDVATRRQSRLAFTATVNESNSDHGPHVVTRAGVKRAILPAAISDPAVIRLLAEAESREPPRR